VKYYQINFPGEFGQHVEEIWSEKQILDSYYTSWCAMMIQNMAAPDLNEMTCIADWCVVHWAVEVKKPDWITEKFEDRYEYSEEYDAHYDKQYNIWVEDTCDDPNCDFCANRPERPL
jgi:hypothetical protein